DSVIIKTEADRAMIYAGDDLVMNVYENDAGIEGVNKDILAQIFRQIRRGSYRALFNNQGLSRHPYNTGPLGGRDVVLRADA
ncbi:MAG: hypothetical protein MUC95_08275, partial [Spirochaetes bacterium]|nr:hypothetical protein [Spirochaetota bacterium]